MARVPKVFQTVERRWCFARFPSKMISATPTKNDFGLAIPRLPYISIAERKQVVALNLNGISAKEISCSLGIRVRSIRRIIKSWKIKRTVSPKPKKSGRTRKITPAIERKMVQLLEADRRLTPAEVIRAIQALHPGFRCCASSVQRIFVLNGYHGRVCVKKPLLREANKQKRLEWAQKHVNWTLEQWKQVLWSDEKKFELFNSKRRLFCRRKEGEPLHDDTIQPTVKHGGGSIMFWGCFGGTKTGHLFKINGILDQAKYKQILIHHAMPSGLSIFPDSVWHFMQDNDPKHTSKTVQAYLQEKMKQRGCRMKVMDWVSQSPDLNPLELLWEESDRQVKLRKPINLAELEAAVRHVWQNMPEKKMLKLI